MTYPHKFPIERGFIYLPNGEVRCVLFRCIFPAAKNVKRSPDGYFPEFKGKRGRVFIKCRQGSQLALITQCLFPLDQRRVVHCRNINNLCALYQYNRFGPSGHWLYYYRINFPLLDLSDRPLAIIQTQPKGLIFHMSNINPDLYFHIRSKYPNHSLT